MIKYKNILYLDIVETIYTSAIKKELESFSDNVETYYYHDIYIPSIYERILCGNRSKNNQASSVLNFIEYLKTRSYDFILVKSVYAMPVFFFEELCNHFKNVPIINYNWSSIKMYNVLNYVNLFTKVYSFDREDCLKYNFNYYPLFFIKEFQDIRINNNINSQEFIYDLAFIGSGYNAGRLLFLNKMIEIINNKLYYKYFYIYTPGYKKSMFVRLRYHNLAKYCHWKHLSLNQVLNVFRRSNSMIDHPMIIQSGLTIRTFETLAAGIHLYTTNTEIANEPFYDNKRITIVNSDLDNFSIKNEDSTARIKGTWNDSFSEYRIDNWLKNILKI